MNAIWKNEYTGQANVKPLTLNTYGTLEIDMVVKNESKHFTKHPLLTFDLFPDASKDAMFRLVRILRSGFRINPVDYKEIISSEAETPATSVQGKVVTH